jgi:hypothetical protein
MAGITHLARRFFGSLRPGGPTAIDAEWAEAQLLPDEVVLWRSMSRTDRRHAAGVARRVEVALGNEAARPVLAAALLHDVGKTEANLGTYGRVIATVSGQARPDIVRAWTRTGASPERRPLPAAPRIGATSWRGRQRSLGGVDPRAPPARTSGRSTRHRRRLKAADDD